VRTSLIASIARILAITSLVLFAGAPLAIQLGLAGPRAFFAFLVGLLLGALSLLLGLVALVATRNRPGRGAAWSAVLIGLVVLGLGIVLSGGGGRGLPPINDITTDLADPPSFVFAVRQEPNQGRDMDYPAEFAEQQQAGYPDLAPIPLDAPPSEAVNRVAEAARSLGWEIVDRDDAAGRLEATQTSRIFRFVDDIVVRVRPATGGGSIVDVRSKSRLGRSDIGANAARIRALRDAL
jgi:uncharacterized protein (DUF1499 family)